MKYVLKFFGIIFILLIAAVFTQFFRLVPVQSLFKVTQPEVQKLKKTLSSGQGLTDSTKYLVLYSTADTGSKAVLNNVFHSFRMAKLNYDKLSIDKKWHVPQFNEYKAIVFATESLYKIDEQKINRIKQYVKNGGRVIFLVRAYFPKYNDLLGIAHNNGYLDENLVGLEFKHKFFPGLDSLKIETQLIVHSALDVKLTESVKVLATTPAGHPIIWTNGYGEGMAVFINSSMIEDKLNRGVLLQSVGYGADYFLTTVFNGKIMDIDDFPSPIKQGRDPIIYAEYSMNNRTFFRNIWWSSIYNIGKKYNIKYTGLMIGSYNLATKLPIPAFNDIEISDISYFGRKLAEINGEIGIHGYNHNSLVLRGQMMFGEYGYSEWDSQETMEASLLKLKQETARIYGDIPIYTYVPPSNIISAEGKRAVKNIFPELKMIAGLYTGTPEKGVEYQEFGKDPVLKDVYNLPRLSAGYSYTPSEMWAIYNGIASYGVFNHFIHPDDILDRNRSGDRTWKAMAGELESLCRDTYHYFPFLRAMTNIEAYHNLRGLEQLKVYSKKEDRKIRIQYEKVSPPVYHYLRLKTDKVSQVVNGSFERIESNRDYNLYLIRGDKENIEILLK